MQKVATDGTGTRRAKSGQNRPLKAFDAIRTAPNDTIIQTAPDPDRFVFLLRYLTIAKPF